MSIISNKLGQSGSSSSKLEEKQSRPNMRILIIFALLSIVLARANESRASIIGPPMTAAAAAVAATATTTSLSSNSFREVAAAAASSSAGSSAYPPLAPSTFAANSQFAASASGAATTSTKSIHLASSSSGSSGSSGSSLFGGGGGGLAPAHAHLHPHHLSAEAGNAHAQTQISRASNEPESIVQPTSVGQKLTNKDNSNNNGNQFAYNINLDSNNQHNQPAPEVITKDLCQIKNGESVAIVEIEESRGSAFGQRTNPIELPIIGSTQDDEIELKIESETHKYFQLNGKKLELTKALNRDPVFRENSSSGLQIQHAAISSVYLQLSCIDKTKSHRRSSNSQSAAAAATNETSTTIHPTPNSRVIVPVLVKVIDINDNAPRFASPNFTVQVNELAPVGTTILGSDQLRALDLDSAVNGLVEYSLSAGPTSQTSGQIKQEPAKSTNQLISSTTSTTAPPQTSTLPTAAATTKNAQTQRVNNQQKQPTININNEPIQNGPMDDSDEESDESLLASLANSTVSQASGESLQFSPNSGMMLPDFSTEPDSQAPDSQPMSKEPGDSSDFAASSAARAKRAKKRKRRHHLLPLPLPLPTPLNIRHRRRATLADKPKPAPSPALASTQPVPWTNLMDPQSVQINANSAPLSNEPEVDSSDFFSLEMGSLGPTIRLKRPLDFEARPLHQLTIVATDKASNKSERLSSSAQIFVRVTDGDDQAPMFLLEEAGCKPSSPVSNFELLESNLDKFQAMGSSNVAQRIAPNNGLKILTDLSDDFDFGDTADTGRQQPFAVILPHPSSSRGKQVTGASKHTTDYLSRPPCTSSYAAGAPEYWASVMAGDSDQLVSVLPQPIKARDRDQLNAPVSYNFVNGTPANYSHYFQINPVDGLIKQVAPIDRISGQPERFVIWVEAQEQTAKRHSSQAKLTIDVKAADWAPPTLEANFYSGYVNENSQVGTLIKQTSNSSGQEYAQFSQLPMRVQLTQNNSRKVSSSGSPFGSVYEFETTSDLFKVDKDGFVYVAQASLDADSGASGKAPVFMFQVTAKLAGHSRAQSSHSHDQLTIQSHSATNQTNATLSAQLAANSRLVTMPISLNVSLLDLDDNGPQLMLFNQPIDGPGYHSSPPIQLQSSSHAGLSRHLTSLQANDRDIDPENRQHKFKLLHVSNGARDRFKLDEITGDLKAVGKFAIGEQFSLTVQVSDVQARTAQSILEVIVVPGPNLSAPQFVASNVQGGPMRELDERSASSHLAIGDFSAEITEALAPHSPVFQVHATDPENDQITYNLVGGNVNQDFYINQNTGVIYVQNKLDREEVSQYHLLVQARDSGGLATVRGLKLKILDTNDENPVFQQEQYEFSVSEDQPIGSVVGRVRASDADAGDFGRVKYLLVSTPNSANSNEPMFAINENSGEVRLMHNLDFEKSTSHSLIIRAQDHDKRPRSASCRVLIKVLDVQDELPYFDQAHQHFELQILENQPINEPLAGLQINALDPDSTPEVAYEFKWTSAKDVFSIDSKSGRIELIQNVDYENIQNYTLIVGTSQSQLSDAAIDAYRARLVSREPIEKSPLCLVEIKILDLNDNEPKFDVDKLNPIRVKSSAQLGTEISTIIAHDRDGSKPNNLVHYELIGSQNTTTFSSSNNNNNNSQLCSDYFMLDATSGQLLVKSDLRRLGESECQLDILATDSGVAPGSLSTKASMTIYIDHIAEQPTVTSMLAFSDNNFWTELSENSMPGSLVKVLPIINKSRKPMFPYSCELINGDTLDYARIFHVTENKYGDCEVRLREDNNIQLLDYEKNQRFTLTVKLNSIAASISGSIAQTDSGSQPSGASSASSGPQTKNVAQLVVNVLDRNDNKPIVQGPTRYADLTQGRFLAVIPGDSPTDTQVMQIKATDLDSEKSGNGLLTYQFFNSSLRKNTNEITPANVAHRNGFEIERDYLDFFSIDQSDGIIRTRKPLDEIEQEEPIRLKVVVRDNPIDGQVDRNHETQCEVVVNLISLRHRIALAFPGIPTTKLAEIKNELLSIIQERSGLISGLERLESLKVRRKSSQSQTGLSPTIGSLRVIESDTNGTDFWFYLIEPGTLKLVSNHDPRVLDSLLSDRAQTSLKDIIQQRLGVQELRIRLPYQTITYDPSPLPSSSVMSVFGGFNWLLGGGSGPATPVPGQSNQVESWSNKTINYATRFLFSLSNQYTKVPGDQYAGYLICGAILITLSSLMMLFCQCRSTKARSQPNKFWTNQEHQQSRKKSKAKMSNHDQIKEARLHQQAQILQHHLESQTPLSPQSYFMPMAGSTDQQATGTMNTSIGNTYESFASPGGAQLYGSSFSTANGLSQIKTVNDMNGFQNQLYANGLNASDIQAHQHQTLARKSQEYETQMMKMSVIYDDSRSVDDRNNNNNANKIVTDHQ